MRQLLMWGFTLRSRGEVAGVAEVVGIAARDVLGLVDSSRRPLGGDRIEQIFEAWLADMAAQRAEPGGWKYRFVEAVPRPWLSVKKATRVDHHGAGLVDMRPHWYPEGPAAGPASLDTFVRALLHREGRWPRDEAPTALFYGDLALTDGAQKADDAEKAKLPRLGIGSRRRSDKTG